MSPDEEASFRALYTEWSVERLARAATKEKNDYRPEAVALMLAELARRGVAEEALPAVLSSIPPPPPPPPEKDTFLFPARLGRLQYLLRWLVLVILLVLVGAALECVPVIAGYGFAVAAVVGVGYFLGAVARPRIKSIGWNPWVLLLFFVPLANFGLHVILLFAPSEE